MVSTAGAPVVVGVDASEASGYAVDWATDEAALRHRPLRVVHVLTWPLVALPTGPIDAGPVYPGLRKAAEETLAGAVDRVRARAPRIELADALPEGGAANRLIAESGHAALLVVGHRGLGGFAGLLLGSVGVQVAAHAACPVIVVRPPRPAGRTGPVVVGLDGSDMSELALQFAFEEASMRGVGLIAVHAWRWPAAAEPGDMLPLVYDLDDLQAEEARVLAEALAGHRERYPDVPVEQRSVRGRPGAVLVAASAGAGLLVVGCRGRGGLTGLLLGSTSQAVLHHAECPVAVVRPH
jgi:nucleotide-binding universal stress UspA family protein